MAPSNPATARSRALGALAVLVLALLISLALFVGRGGCTSAVAFDRPAVGEPQPAGLDAARVVEAPTASRDESASDAERYAKRGAAVVALGPVSGVVVDATTREIVPYVEVELALGTRVERIAVGEDGRFASAAHLPSGELRAVVRDDGVEVGGARIAHDAARGTIDWRVEVPIGPTIPIAGIDDRPIRADAWRARIVESALNPEIVGEIAVTDLGLVATAPSAARPDREWSWLLFRPGNRPWIRYPRCEYAPSAGSRASLELRDDAANRKGAAGLKKTVGVHQAVKVDTAPFAKARLRILRAPEHEKLPMRVVVYDTRDEPIAGATTAPVFDEGRVDEKGEIEVADLDGGTKHVVGWSREERVDHHVLVSEGPSEFVEVPAKRADRQDHGRWKNVELPWYMADVVHVVALPAVAEGRMRGWMSTEREGRVQRDELYGAYGGIDLRVVMGSFTTARYEGSPTYRLAAYGFEIADRAEAEVVFGPVGGLFPTEGRSARSPFVLWEELDFTWSAWSEGQRPVFGDRRAFQAGAEGKRTAKLDFEPGWGAQIVLRAGSPADIVDDPPMWTDWRLRGGRRVRARAAPSADAAVLAAPPVPGVTLQVDGFDEATSDAAGELRVSRAFQPQQLTLVGRGWRLTALERMPGDAPRYVAWLRRHP